VADRTGLGAPAERDDRGALRIGSIGGVDVMVRSSWLLVAALISYVVAPQIDEVSPGLGGLKYVAGLAFAVLLTLSLLLHEVSHALMAKRYGIGVRSITLHFIGGVTAIDGEPKTPRQEFAIAAVGPATSLGIGLVALALFQVTPDGLLGYAVAMLAGANLVVGVLNLVPGMPLDGGRVLRAAVWKITGNPHRALAVSGWAGRGVALLVLAAPLLLPGLGVEVTTIDFIIAVVFGWFLWSAASSAIAGAKVRARLPALQARSLARRTVTAPADLSLAEAVRLAQQAQAGSIVTVDVDGSPVGVVNEAAVQATPRERRPWMAVSSVSRSLDPGLRLPADIAGEQLILAMQSTPATEYLLVEADGSVYGVLTTRDVDAAFRATSR
jgi:Zn-dependent protease/CBS domain-containing protein